MIDKYEKINEFSFVFQILSASLYIAEHLPDGADGLWALVNAASWCALGELEWVPFSVIRRATDINLLGKFSKMFYRHLLNVFYIIFCFALNC